MIDLTKLFTGPEQWFQGANYANSRGLPCLSEEARRWCLAGRLTVLNLSGFSALLVQAIGELFPNRVHEGFIYQFNDSDATTFADVQAVLKRAQQIMEDAA